MDKLIIGAGLYGLYSALHCGKKGENIIVVEFDEAPFKRATYINQARVHMGYHYPRSISTAKKSAGYFNKFNDDYGYCVNSEFEKIYATSKKFSWTNSEQFEKFCKDSNIECRRVSSELYFKDNMVDGAFHTKEYTYDAQILKDKLLEEIKTLPNVQILYNTRIEDVTKEAGLFKVRTNHGILVSPFVLNATYASVNSVNKLFGYDRLNIKYELCEIILCKVNERLAGVGITVMDGPFFSIMPFGKTGLHSLTSVTFTPHDTSYDDLPTFSCQKESKGFCSPERLGNCNDCPAKPKSAWDSMSTMARKYLASDLEFEYVESLFSMKPILVASEIDDSRPTVIRCYNNEPTFYAVLSGKINTVYDLMEVLDEH